MAVDDYDSLYQNAGQAWNVDPGLLRAVATVESGGNPAAVSRKGARGVMQFEPETAKRYGLNDLSNPIQSIFGSANYLSDLLNQHNGDVAAALQEYNGSSNDPQAGYARKVLAAYKPMKAAMNPSISDPPMASDLQALGQPTAPASQQPAASAAQQPAAPTPDRQTEPPMASDLQGLGAPSAPPTTPTAQQPASAQTATGAQAPTQLPASAPSTDSGPSPLTTMLNPSLVPEGQKAKPVLGIPLAQSIGAGLVQGARDVGQTVSGWEAAGDKAFPWLGRLDQMLGLDPAATQATLAGQTSAFGQQYATDLPANIARVGGQIATTAPLLGPLGGAAEAAAGTAGRVIAPVVGRLAGAGAEGAVIGGGTNALTSGGYGENPLQAAAEGAVGGGILGAGGRLAGATLAKLGGGINAPLQNIADRLGIDLSFGQKVGGIPKQVEDASAILPGSGAAKFGAQQNSQIAQVIAKEAGISGPITKLDTNVLNNAENTVGQQLDHAASQITIQPSQNLRNSFVQIAQDAAVPGLNTPSANTARNLLTQVTNTMQANSGVLPGPEFQQLIRRNGTLDRLIRSSNRDVADVAQQIKGALLDEAANSGQGNAAALKDLQQARYQWKVIQSVRPSIDTLPSGTEELNPARLATAIGRNFDMTQTGPGSNMQDLARLINATKPLPSSGTAERLARYGLYGGVPVLGGGLAGTYYYSPENFEENLGNALAYSPLLLAGRASRFGPAAFGNALRPFVKQAPARLFGPRVGRSVLDTTTPLAP